MFIRVVDVAGALRGRRYGADGSLTIELTDAFCPWNAGTWRVEAMNGEGTVERSDDEPDLRMSATELGMIYLGGMRAGSLARAGRMSGDAEAVRLADLMFSWHVLPWCPEIF